MNSVLARLPKLKTKTPSIRSLYRELQQLRQRVEDLEDLRELNQAIERNGLKPLIPWSKARKELGID